MEDNSCSDDEIKISPSSPKLGTKKLKLNDGSSQDSIKETREYFFNFTDIRYVFFLWVNFCFLFYQHLVVKKRKKKM